MIWIAVGTVLLFLLTRWIPEAYLTQTTSAPLRRPTPMSVALTDDVTVRPA